MHRVTYNFFCKSHSLALWYTLKWKLNISELLHFVLMEAWSTSTASCPQQMALVRSDLRAEILTQTHMAFTRASKPVINCELHGQPSYCANWSCQTLKKRKPASSGRFFFFYLLQARRSSFNKCPIKMTVTDINVATKRKRSFRWYLVEVKPELFRFD